MRRPSVIVAGVLAMGGWLVWLLNATFVIQGFFRVGPFEPAYLVIWPSSSSQR